MKFDSTKDSILYKGDEYFNSHKNSECCVCKEQTAFCSASFESKVCSTECAEDLWEQYINAELALAGEESLIEDII